MSCECSLSVLTNICVSLGDTSLELKAVPRWVLVKWAYYLSSRLTVCHISVVNAELDESGNISTRDCCLKYLPLRQWGLWTGSGVHITVMFTLAVRCLIYRLDEPRGGASHWEGEMFAQGVQVALAVVLITAAAIATGHIHRSTTRP
ncbi:unnamed protein product [Arctogadus glacialis]